MNSIFALHIILGAAVYLTAFVITYLVLAHGSLFYRYLKIKFGARIKPDRQKAILITGATSGIGLLLAKHFYKLGFTVIACYYNNKEPGYKELSELSTKSEEENKLNEGKGNEEIQRSHLFLVPMDVTSKESIVNAAKEVESLLETNNLTLNSLINNAGAAFDGPFEFSDVDCMKTVLETNMVGVISVTRQFILRIIMDKGRVVNVSSGLFLLPGFSYSIYGSTKSAIAYFSVALHEDIRRYGASCHCVVPGNFVSNSNIILTRLKCFQQSLGKLTDLEKTLYSSNIERHRRMLYGFVRKRLELTKEDPKELESVHNVEIPRHLLTPSKKPNLFKRIMHNILSDQLGGRHDQTLEQSGIANGFEQAVCLKHPPERLYAGNALHSNLFAPSMEYLPYGLIRGLADMVVGSMTR